MIGPSRKLTQRRVEEDQGIEGAMLRQSRHLALDGQVCEKSADFICSSIRRMTRGMKQNKSLDPADVCFFRAQTHMLEAHDVSHVVE